jgi:transcriptional regulator with XRE-family HTH domain
LEVGLLESSKRRTPGLRREEVATLAGVGLSWYTWLEQGRVTSSKQVLEAVARALQLSDEETVHVMALAGFQPTERPDRSGRAVDTFRTLAVGWTNSPAVLVDRHLDMLAWNEAYARLWPDPAEISPMRRNLLLAAVETKALAVLPPDSSSMAWDLAKQLRAHATRSPDERFSQLYALLRHEHPELAAWWECKSVGEFMSRNIVVRGIDLVVCMMRPSEAPDCAVLVQTPSSAADRARLDYLLAGNLRQAG